MVDYIYHSTPKGLIDQINDRKITNIINIIYNDRIYICFYRVDGE